MSIRFFEKEKAFVLQTKDATYSMKVSAHGHLLHLYYGKKIHDVDLEMLLPVQNRGMEVNPPCVDNRTYTFGTYPQEFSTNDAGDYRPSSIELRNPDGSYSFVGTYKTHRIYEGKYSVKGMPSIFANEGDGVETLEIDLVDEVTGVVVTLYYSVYPNQNVITRATKLTNGSNGTVHLYKLASTVVDFTAGDFDMVSFYGRHCWERNFERVRLSHGTTSVGSTRGLSSHHENPFTMLCTPDTTEDNGCVYGFNLVYSGNFLFEANNDPYSETRAVMGINPKQFDFVLEAGEEFMAPEVIMSFSDAGFAKLSQQYHDIFRHNACRSKWVGQRRPIIINSWEPLTFTFDADTLFAVAEAGKDIGAEMFVLDDGWFGARDNALAGLGDWVVNEKKLVGGLKGISDRVHGIGMKFGLWFEPEMVNEDSDLYRAHPEWCLRVPNRGITRGRYQYLLDLSRPEVCDYVINAVNKILDEGGIDYVKWDYNRSVCDAYNASLPADKQGEVYHRYMLGVYKVHDGIILSHPDILFEGCSSGGGRFDAGMLTYFPQIWTSDNTDAMARLKIQYGTSFAYPVSSMGAHVSVARNRYAGSVISMKTRNIVAMHGTYGYELDPAKMSEDEKQVCRDMAELYKSQYDLINAGTYYRLSSPFGNDLFTAWMFVSADKNRAFATAVLQNTECNGRNTYIKLKGLVPDQLYSVNNGELILTGSTLMNVGIHRPANIAGTTAYTYIIEKYTGSDDATGAESVDDASENGYLA